MSYIIGGANGKDWQGANWICSHLFKPLLKNLKETPRAENLVERLEEAMETQIGYTDISDLLESPELRNVWIESIDKTVSELKSEGSEGWSKPEEFQNFINKVEELKEIAIT